MLVFDNLNEVKIDDNTCVTIGNFDGVHIGHQALIKKAVKYSRENDLKSVVFTFSNHPMNFFKPNTVKNIITSKEKENLVKSLGVDIYISIEFNEDMTKISAEDYIKNILVDKLNVKRVIIGHDFSFARKKEGNSEILSYFGKKFGFEVEVESAIKIDDKRVSSTDIRKYIQNGEVENAEKLLGRKYSLSGEVVRARQIGRTIGFPTANIEFEKNNLLPLRGVYATEVHLDRKIYMGATSVGTNPTVDGKSESVETFILDFDEDIYGSFIEVLFVDRIREEVRFDSKEKLKNQLIEDVEKVRKILTR